MKITLDINRSEPVLETINLRQGDGGLTTIEIEVTKDNQLFALAGYTLQFEGNLPSGKMVQANAALTGGVFVYTFRKADTSEIGAMPLAYFRLYDSSKNAVATRNLRIVVSKTADVSAGQASDYLANVDKLTETVKKEVAASSQSLATLKTQVEAVENGLKDVDLNKVQDDIEDLQGFVGYNDAEIFGTEVDMTNKTFKRLAGSINRSPVEGFDTINTFGGRKRCILTDDGKVLAYFGETGYTETGALLQALTKNEVVYPIGTKVQVMVEQPLFYYRVTPLVLDPITDGKGFHMRKARYYVSDKPKTGFKVHPAFVVDGAVREKIYVSAFEGSIYDTSAGAYVLNDEQIADFAADTFASIAGAKPASGLTQDLTRANLRLLAQKRGEGWQQSYAATIAMTQLLFLIEYNSFNWQAILGQGPTQKVDDTASNMAEPTGASTTLGNKSGQVVNLNGINITSYRGEENFFGNIWKTIDGMNLMANGVHSMFIADHEFAEKVSTGAYMDCGFTVCKTNGHVSAFGYGAPEFDWLFMTSETAGNTSVPVGDHFYQNSVATDDGGWRSARLGGRWDNSSSAGGFYWILRGWLAPRVRDIGGRLVYVA